MKIRRSLFATVLVGALLVSCSDSESSGGTTSSSAASTTSVAPTTTQPSTTTASPTTVASSTTTAPAATTIPVVAGLDLAPDGLGGESFGAEAEGVISYVVSILGPPTEDSGWYDFVGGACGASEGRYVSWRDLQLEFLDASPATTGLRHFSGYRYGSAAGPVIDPFGPSIDGEVTVGDTVDELLAIYPSTEIFADEETNSTVFQIVDGLGGSLTGSSGSDTIKSFLGGFRCGA